MPPREDGCSSYGPMQAGRDAAEGASHAQSRGLPIPYVRDQQLPKSQAQTAAEGDQQPTPYSHLDDPSTPARHGSLRSPRPPATNSNVKGHGNIQSQQDSPHNAERAKETFLQGRGIERRQPNHAYVG